MSRRVALFLAGVLFAAFEASAANISVPILELITRGYVKDSSFVLGTHGRMDFQVSGGYKFGGEIVLDFESDDLESLDVGQTQEYVRFKSASVTMRDPFGLPLELSYFTGETDTFGAGDLFPDYFGTMPIASRFRGYLYFPDPDQTRYDGVHTVDGTGLKLSSTLGVPWTVMSLYVYQDAYLGTGYYSADFWASFNSDRFKVETFVGASYPISTYGYYRAGLLMFYDTGMGGEFLTQIGVTRWDPQTDPLAIDMFFFLFEPRVTFGVFSIILTLFWHPEYYHQVSTGELGSADINAKFQFGVPEVSPASGGIETMLSFSSSGDDQFKAVVAPYFSAITSGVIWNFKVNAKVFPFNLSDLVDVFVGVRAEF